MPPERRRAGSTTRSAAEIARLAAHERVRAIGETGSTTTAKRPTPEEQRRAFEAQIEIAAEQGLPIVIHARDPDGETGATDDVFEILDARADGGPVILHCFSLPGGSTTRSSAAGTARSPGSSPTRSPTSSARPPRSCPSTLLVETDAPYLAPQPVRGRPNEPANVVATAEVVAQVRGESYEELERTVEANARGLFGW